MKRNFVPAFLGAIGCVASGLVDVFARESLHYKDLRLAGYDPRAIYKGYGNLKHRGILRERRDGCFCFTPRGTRWLKRSVRRYFPLRYPTWDGKWRLVMFDIPQEKTSKRISLGRKMKLLGFYPLQKSVFVLPYPCDEEMADIARPLDVGRYIDIITAESLGYRQEEVKKYFDL